MKMAIGDDDEDDNDDSDDVRPFVMIRKSTRAERSKQEAENGIT